jgi:hypothetical protein
MRSEQDRGECETNTAIAIDVRGAAIVPLAYPSPWLVSRPWLNWKFGTTALLFKI